MTDANGNRRGSLRGAGRLLVSSLALMACNGGAGEETRTIVLSHMTPDQALELVEPYLANLKVARRTTNPAALTITAPGERIDQITELLHRFDVPTPNVQLRFQLIEADGFTQTDSSIADVESALRELFRFRGYRLVADAFATGSTRTSTSHYLSGPRDTPLQLTVDIGQVTASRATQNGAAGAITQTVELHVTLLAGGTVFLQSAVSVPDGQTIVVGTARPFPDMGALILVVRPEIE